MKNPLLPLLHLAITLLTLTTGMSEVSAASAESNIFILDTRGTGSLTVTGRVLSKATGLPLAGATVTLAGQTATIGGTGTFEFRNTGAASGSTLTASASGYMPVSTSVLYDAGQKSVDVGILRLQGATAGPVVEWVRPDLTGLFLPGWGILFTADARINWNGGSPGTVDFYSNGSLVASHGGSGPEYAASFSVDDDFTPSLRAETNQITVIATNSLGSSSPPFTLDVFVLPVPGSFSAFLIDPSNIQRNGNRLILKVKFPPDPGIKKTVSLPILGDFGGKFQSEGEVDYGFSSGEWELELGGSAQVLLGTTKVDVGIAAKGAGSATVSNGLTLDQIGASLSFESRFDLGKFGILDLLGPGVTTSLSKIPGLGKALNVISIVIELEPGLSGSVMFAVSPEFAFDSAELTGKVGLNAAYKPDIKVAKVKLYVGGEPRLTFQIPGDLFQQIGFRAYAGVEASVWRLVIKKEVVFVNYSYPTAARRLPLTGIEDLGNGYRIAAAANATAEWAPVERTWREAGAERFLLAVPKPGRRLDVESAEAIAAQDIFARMGSATTTGAAYTPPQTSPTRRIASDPDLPAQVDLPLLANVMSDSEPALAGNGDTLMLLYVRDTGVPNPVQFTEIAWTFFDGASWSTPAALASDPRGQFKPQVVFDGNGDAIAVFERIKDAAYAGTEIETMAAEMEIVWSRWDHVTQTWSTPAALTDNAFVDHSPQLAGPLADGDLLLVWTQNEANELQGTGAPGDHANSRILIARWDCATLSWGTATTLVDQLTYELSGDLAVSGQGAVYLWSRDMDGNLDDFSDAELFYRVWVESSGLWLPAVQFTSDSVYDRNAELAMDPAGNVYAIWQRGDDLVMDVNFAGTPSVVRLETDTLGFADYALTLGPGGNLLVLWQEMNEAGSDAHYRVYDPASATWGLDTLLSQDSDLETAFAPVWDAMGNLTLAYTNTEITRETVSVEIEGGEIIDVEGVPQPGQVDLLAAKRALVKDLEIGADGLVAEGTDFLPGDSVSITVTLRNSGNVAVQDPVVGLYIGDPDDGGDLVEERTITGWLKAADTAEEVFNWTVPEPAIPRTLFAVVDASGAVTEFDEENNQQFLPLNGIDYELEYVSGSVLSDGSVRVVARVTNRGAPASPVTQLDLWPQEAPGADPLASATVSLLNPGDSVELALELPPGSHAEGEAAYRLVVDEGNLSGDILPDNNAVLFSLNLWIDDDGDGVPKGWEEANGLSDSDPDDVLLDSDGDGFSDKAEYLAGTDPDDPNSYLKIGEFNTIQGAGGDPDRFVLSWASASGSLYRVVRSYDLSSWHAVADDIPADPPLNTLEDVPDPAEPSVFYRIEAK